MHLCDALRMASGELVIPLRNMPLRYTPIKQMVIYWAPFPHNAPTAPECLTIDNSQLLNSQTTGASQGVRTSPFG